MSRLICVAGGKGAPGATTLALAMALTCAEAVTLVDADPDGGDVAPLIGLPSSPGLVTLVPPQGQAVTARLRGLSDTHAFLDFDARHDPLPSQAASPPPCTDATDARGSPVTCIRTIDQHSTDWVRFAADYEF